MKTIRILEEKTGARSDGFDHIFSFSSNPADSFPHDYINQKEVQLIYDETYSKLCDVLESNQFKEQFTYQGVYLLWCFRKELFNHIYSLILRYETFKRVLDQNQGALFQLVDNSNQIGLTDIIKANPPTPSHVLLIENQNKSSNKIEPDPAVESRLWRHVFKLGNIKKSEVAVFSDFQRSKTVITYLKSRNPVLFLNCPSPRIILKAILNRLPFFQIAFNSKHKCSYQRKAEAFLKLWSERRIFKNVFFREMNYDRFLHQKMADLLSKNLPGLLFEIDRMNQFFNEAQSLRSVLLDEDIDAGKNAFCQIARKFGVPSFVELHGALCDKHGFLPLTADYLFVWGQAQKSKLISWGCPPEKILVSGCSRYSFYQQMDAQKVKKTVAKKLGIDYHEKIVLVAFVPISRWNSIFEERMQQIISETLDVISEFAHQARFIIKVHPADENIARYETWLKKNNLKGRVLIIKKFDPLLLAKAADLLIVYRSTYSVDGFALDKPVICLYDHSDLTLSEFRPFSIFYYSNDKNTLRQLCHHLLRESVAKPGRWEEAKIQCLNEGVSPGEIIAQQLLSVQKRKV